MKAENYIEFGTCGLEHTLPRLKEICGKYEELPIERQLSCLYTLGEKIDSNDLKLAWGMILMCGTHLSNNNICTPLEGVSYTDKAVGCRADGSIYNIYTLKDGILDGSDLFFDEFDGHLYLISRYSKGTRQGLTERFYSSGTLKYRVNYHEGGKHGLEEAFYEDGKVSERCMWKNGEEVSDVEIFVTNGYKTTHTPWSIRRKQIKGSGFPKQYYVTSNKNTTTA